MLYLWIRFIPRRKRCPHYKGQPVNRLTWIGKWPLCIRESYVNTLCYENAQLCVSGADVVTTQLWRLGIRLTNLHCPSEFAPRRKKTVTIGDERRFAVPLRTWWWSWRSHLRDSSRPPRCSCGLRSSSWLPAFWDSILVPSSRVKGCLTLQDGTDGLSQNVGNQLLNYDP